MAKKYYVVWQGRKPGVFDNWNEAKLQVDKFAGAKYKSFPSLAEAKAAFSQSADKIIGQTSSAAANKAKASPNKKAKPKATDFELPNKDVVIFTDGGCEPNPGKAGSGIAVYRQGKLTSLWYGLYDANGTNNTAELNALHQALLMAKQAIERGMSVHILSDSQYSINCISQWAYGWKAKGWTKKSGEIANLSLIQQAHTLFDDLSSKITLEHVAAHIGIEGNELADRMSIYAVDQQQTAFCKYTDPIILEDILSLRAG
ncbi:viroplasmin family protein [Shewanella maritima]|uniref:ribonuclease H1 domain-containing protein n=1 Tax=Shewanella maritima TaxID=2520507 RepID=UPI0037355414